VFEEQPLSAHGEQITDGAKGKIPLSHIEDNGVRSTFFTDFKNVSFSEVRRQRGQVYILHGF
jgi:hypothetical protein